MSRRVFGTASVLRIDLNACCPILFRESFSPDRTPEPATARIRSPYNVTIACAEQHTGLQVGSGPDRGSGGRRVGVGYGLGMGRDHGEEFVRDTNYIEDRITRDGRDGWPVEAGRYRLVAARACPWAHRTVIVRRLLGLEDAMSLALAGPTHDERSWTFDLDPDGLDPVLGIHFLRDAFNARFADYPKGVTVPTIVDVPTGQVVTNAFAQITEDMYFEWVDHHRPGAPNLWPEAQRAEMETLMERIYHDVNNAVYEAGFGLSQSAYEDAYGRLFTALDELSDRLETTRYLMGGTITEADIRLFTTLVRFDAVYHGHFKCNRSKLSEMPVLWAYARDLFQTPGFGDTTDFEQIKTHYYWVHAAINPTRVVPLGPDPTNWLTPHGRESLGGSPFGDGTPPGDPSPAEAVPSLS